MHDPCALLRRCLTVSAIRLLCTNLAVGVCLVMTMHILSDAQVSSNSRVSVERLIMFINRDVKMSSNMNSKLQSNFSRIFSEMQTSSSID